MIKIFAGVFGVLALAVIAFNLFGDTRDGPATSRLAEIERQLAPDATRQECIILVMEALADELFATHINSLMKPDPLDVIQGGRLSAAERRLEQQMRISDAGFQAAIAGFLCHKLPGSKAAGSE